MKKSTSINTKSGFCMQDKELDYVWELFTNQDDCVTKDLVEATLYFIRMYDFNKEELPDDLLEAVNKQLEQDALESHFDDLADDILGR